MKGRGSLMMEGALAGLRLVEFDGMGPTPFAGKLLADLGAEVVRIARAGEVDRASAAEMLSGRSVIRLDLKVEAGREAALRLISQADGMIEGFRPGVMERLGLGPDQCLLANPALAYVRITGWGQHGPLAIRAGHDLNYIAITGALHSIGSADRPPPPPLNLLGDYGGGSAFAVIGLLAAILQARATGRGQVVDAAMVDAVAALSTAIHSLRSAGQWCDLREANTLDGGAPFYRCYECEDGKFVSVAALEPQFFGLLLDGLEIDRARFVQRDRDQWPVMAEAFAAAFAARSRDAWAAVFDSRDACVTPVLSFEEAKRHPHNIARGTYESSLPAAAPRFSLTPGGSAQRGEEELDGIIARWSESPKRDVASDPAAEIAISDG